MIPILYNPEEIEFATNGIGALADCISCKVTEERNGVYECEFKYPVSGPLYSQIQEGCIVKVKHDDSADLQPFDIYARTAPLDGVVTFYAHHISYRLSNVIVGPFTASTVAQAVTGMKSNSMTVNNFTLWTDKGSTGEFKVKVPSSFRALLGGTSGSLLDVYGGEYLFDKWTVRLYANRGADNGVQILYGKNLTALEKQYSREGMYNAVIPFWTSNDGSVVVTVPELVVAPGVDTRTVTLTDENEDPIVDENGDPITTRYSLLLPFPMDLSGEFDEAPTVAQLRERAQSKLNGSSVWMPQENLKVSFVQLWQTEEYKDVAPLLRCALCDTVTVRYDALGVNTSMKVIRVVYDCLAERYDEMELGEPKKSLAQVIRQETNVALEDRPTKSMMVEAIDHATELIRGGLGGYVVIGTDPGGTPNEILIMDAPDIASAVNVWRFNSGGLGHSHSGYNGPYDDIALTMDGQINASAITTGVLTANLLKAGIIQGETGENYWNLVTDEFVLRRAKIDILTDDSSYDVIDIRGNNGQWQNRITPLDVMLMSRVVDSLLFMQAGGIWGYGDADGTTNPLHIQSDGAIWLGGDGYNGRIYLKDTAGTIRTILNEKGLQLTDSNGDDFAWMTDDYFQYGKDNGQRFQYSSIGGNKAIYLANAAGVLRTRLFDTGYLELVDANDVKQVGLDSADGDLYLGALGMKVSEAIAALNKSDTWVSTAWAGLTCRAYREGKTVMITLRGTTSNNLGTQNATVAVCTLPSGFRPVVTHTQYVVYGAEYKGQLVLNTDGTVNIGYTRALTATSNVNLPANTNVYITATFVTADD